MRFTVARTLILLALGLAAFLAYPRIAGQVAMDKCLDSGGTWAYGVCRSSYEGVYVEPDPKPVLLGSTAAAAGAVLLGVAVFAVRDRRRQASRAT